MGRHFTATTQVTSCGSLLFHVRAASSHLLGVLIQGVVQLEDDGSVDGLVPPGAHGGVDVEGRVRLLCTVT